MRISLLCITFTVNIEWGVCDDTNTNIQLYDLINHFTVSFNSLLEQLFNCCGVSKLGKIIKRIDSVLSGEFFQDVGFDSERLKPE